MGSLQGSGSVQQGRDSIRICGIYPKHETCVTPRRLVQARCDFRRSPNVSGRTTVYTATYGDHVHDEQGSDINNLQRVTSGLALKQNRQIGLRNGLRTLRMVPYALQQHFVSPREASSNKYAARMSHCIKNTCKANLAIAERQGCSARDV